MDPIIKYRGGKSREIRSFLPYIPEFSGRYVEPFFGGGALFFFLEPNASIINDVNQKLIGFYRGVQTNYQKVRQELDELERIYRSNRRDFDALKKENPDCRVEDKNEKMYYALRDMFNNLAPKKYSDAALYYYINKTAYSGMIRYNAKGEFNVPFGRYPNLNTQKLTQRHSALLQRAAIYNGDYRKIFDLVKKDDFVFLDPPYDCVFSDYGNEEYRGGFDEDCHRQLAVDFQNLSCPAMMIIGRTKLTTELYGKFIVDEYSKSYSVNIRNRFKSSATHIVVVNYLKR